MSEPQADGRAVESQGGSGGQVGEPLRAPLPGRPPTRSTHARCSDLLRTTPEERPRASKSDSGNAAATVSEPDWDALVPRGFYSRFGRVLLNTVLLLGSLPPALALGLPVALVNLVVFRDPRKILFVQERIGYLGRPFRIVKFRTMREARRDAFASWSGEEDRLRVTRFGRFLRNTHLDELPQLINVARGEMNFIGPRPEMREIEEWAVREVPGFSNRLAVKPGITGWAQITQGYTGRCAEAYAEKLAVNEHYRQHQSFRMDFAILLRTAIWMVRGKGWQPPETFRPVVSRSE